MHIILDFRALLFYVTKKETDVQFGLCLKSAKFLNAYINT